MNLKLFSSEPTSLLTVLHETGHQPFGLMDEYCCDGGYWESPTRPNMYTSLANCEADAPNVGSPASDCRQLTRGGITIDWWTSDPTSDDLMEDSGNHTPQALDLRRINWMFSRCDLRLC